MLLEAKEGATLSAWPQNSNVRVSIFRPPFKDSAPPFLTKSDLCVQYPPYMLRILYMKDATA